MSHKFLLRQFALLTITHCSCSKDFPTNSQFDEMIQGVSFLEEEGSVDIDKDHLSSNPECGYVPETPNRLPLSSRISNAEESDIHYPWVILVERQNAAIPTWKCGGSIITQTAAITASHCICGIPGEYADSLSDQAKSRLLCRGGIITDIQLIDFPLPNKAGSDNPSNLIIVRMGSKDKTKGTKLRMRRAYVMGSENKSPDVNLFEDIGLLLTTDVGGYGPTFYQHRSPNGFNINTNIGSVCLAAEKKDRPHMHEGKVVTVGWGIRYKDFKSGNKPIQLKHSCATNRFGSIMATFRPCDVKDITNDPNHWGCHMSKKPDEYDALKCEKYLEQAESAVRKKISKLDGTETLSELWALTNKIEVLGSRLYSGIRKTYVCYKQKLFDNNGWCYVYPMRDESGKMKKDNWGFCGSSCKLMKVKTTPSIYHKMIWEYPLKNPSSCRRFSKDNPDSNDHAMPYYVCMSTAFPHTSVFRFERSKRKDRLKLSDVYNEKREDTFDALSEDDLRNVGYQVPCKGDSGSGHWMYDSRTKKRALVAVNSHSIQNPKTNYCGAPNHNLLTTHPNVLKWIKRYSNIGIS